jgi:hypothetical protein
MVTSSLPSGTQVRIIANTAGAGIPIGTLVTIKQAYSTVGYLVNGYSSFLYFVDMELATSSLPLWESLEEEATELKIRQTILSSVAKAVKDAKVESLSPAELKELKRVIIQSLKLSPVDEARYMCKI